MRLTEEEKKQILSKYNDENTSSELLNHLKRSFPISTTEIEGLPPIKMINVYGKNRIMNSNKKYLVGYISNALDEKWNHLGEDVIRRTIKKFLDGFTME